MKCLVIGASGMAGHVLSLYLIQAGHDVTAMCRSDLSFCRTIKVDLRDDEAVRDAIRSGQYDAVFNYAALLNADSLQNPVEAIQINSRLPHYLASITADMPTRIVQMSSDGIFKGSSGMYGSGAFPDAVDLYGMSKALGELDDGKNVTIRTSVIGPDTRESGTGLFNWFMKQQGHVFGYTRVLWNGLSSLELARAMEAVALSKAVGIINLTPREFVSKFGLLQYFKDYFREHDTIEIEQVSDPVSDHRLVRGVDDFDFTPKGYSEQFADLKAWVNENRSLYPSYYFVR